MSDVTKNCTVIKKSVRCCWQDLLVFVAIQLRSHNNQKRGGGGLKRKLKVSPLYYRTKTQKLGFDFILVPF